MCNLRSELGFHTKINNIGTALPPTSENLGVEFQVILVKEESRFLQHYRPRKNYLKLIALVTKDSDFRRTYTLSSEKPVIVS